MTSQKSWSMKCCISAFQCRIVNFMKDTLTLSFHQLSIWCFRQRVFPPRVVDPSVASATMQVSRDWQWAWAVIEHRMTCTVPVFCLNTTRLHRWWWRGIFGISKPWIMYYTFEVHSLAQEVHYIWHLFPGQYRGISVNGPHDVESLQAKRFCVDKYWN